ncbi:hypothetical protein SAMN04488038_11921 [Solimonas aquatica]|uniref:Uncharacterized protein n=1 Tax=Solimonas aquatica TaxID=489703 RepID=A0A1H9M5U6_9GAMM|nr:hypothetical protein [Solimonas aquatica]SER19130.1 hypothetical protein SAMN04488038_11921 [Solimonas aquatica]
MNRIAAALLLVLLQMGSASAADSPDAEAAAPATGDVSAEAVAAQRPRRTELLGTLSFSDWSGTRTLDASRVAAVMQLDGRLKLPLPGGLTLRASSYGERVQADDESAATHSKALAREAYLDYRHGMLQLAAGWQIIRWGRTEVLNPTDNLAARDYTRLVDSDDAQKLGLPTASLRYNWGPHALQALWQPLFRASRMPLPVVPGLRYQDERDAHSLGAGGLRLDTRDERGGWSLSYFQGPAKRPNLLVSAPDLATGLLRLNHPDSAIFGGDWEWIKGSWAWRGEAAYTRPRQPRREDLSQGEAFLDAVFGVEHHLGSSSVFLQAQWRRILDYRDPALNPAPLRSLAYAHASLSEALYAQSLGIGGGLSYYTADQRSALSLDAAWQPAHGDLVVRPRLRYQLNDQLSLLLGADYFAGPSLGPYGRLQRNSVIFVGLSSSGLWQR